jgi:hypothetical protein
LFLLAKSKTGSKIRLAIIEINNVKEVSQPKACVPPNPEKQKQ